MKKEANRTPYAGFEELEVAPPAVPQHVGEGSSLPRNSEPPRHKGQNWRRVPTRRSDGHCGSIG